MKKITILLLLVALLLCPAALALEGEPLILSPNALAVNLNTGDVVYEKQTTAKIFPASFAKIMTGLLAVENRSNFTTVTVTQTALDATSGNTVGLSAGEVVDFTQLIYALLVYNANDAANVIAETVGSGSIDNFVDMMNERAKQLGANQTNFSNPTGLHSPYMETTMADLVKICECAYKNADFNRISSTVTHIMPATNMSGERVLETNNWLLDEENYPTYYTDDCYGLNSGYTPQAGYCVATVLDKGGINYLIIVSGGGIADVSGMYEHYIDAYDLALYSADKYAYKTILRTGAMICEIEVELGRDVDYAILSCQKDVSVILPSNVDVASEVTYDYELESEVVHAPIEKNQVLGRVNVFYNGELVGSENLVSQAGVERDVFSFVVYTLRNFFTNFYVIMVLLVLILAGAVVFTVLGFKRRVRKDREKM